MKLIDKDALVAEIERILLIHTKRYDELAKHEVWITAKEIEHRIQGLKEALSIINTLEVKEVDLDTAFGVCWGEYCDCGGNINDYKIAKHFFELGLRSTITEEDCKLIWNITDEMDNMPEEEFYKEVLRRYKAKKGE